MNVLKQNMENIFGDKGKNWIAALPYVVDELASYWGLKHVTPVDNMTFNYVAKAVTDIPVVLKVSCDDKSILEEVAALKYFNGNGSIQLIKYNEKYHALLLQQAVPGVTLKSLYPSHLEYVMDCYIDTMKNIHNKSLPNKNNYRHISHWLSAIDHLSYDDCPSHLITKAVMLKNNLLNSMSTEIFLHGDLHHDNILKNGDDWIAIDPKGVVGEPEFETAAFDFMYLNELVFKRDVKNIFEERVMMLSQKAGFNPQRVKDWIFVRLVLMIAWQVEDNGDPDKIIELAGALI